MECIFRIEHGTRKKLLITRIRKPNESSWKYFPKEYKSDEFHDHLVANKAQRTKEATNFKDHTSFKLFLPPEILSKYYDKNSKSFVFINNLGVSIPLLERSTKPIRRPRITKLAFNYKTSGIADFLKNFESQMTENKIQSELIKKLHLLKYVTKEDREEFKAKLEVSFEDFANFFFTFFTQKKTELDSIEGESLESCGSLRKFIIRKFKLADSKPEFKDFQTKKIFVYQLLPFKDSLELNSVLEIQNKQNFIDWVVFQAKERNLIENEGGNEGDENGGENGGENRNEDDDMDSEDEDLGPVPRYPD